MKFKLDENFGTRTQQLFRAARHDVQTVRDERLQGSSDQYLYGVCSALVVGTNNKSLSLRWRMKNLVEYSYEAVFSGEVIEEYPEDKPYPSVLIFGRTMAAWPLHIVCAYSEGEDLTIIITVYHPNPDLWIEYKKRRKP